MSYQPEPLRGKLKIAGTLTFRDKDGRPVGTTEMNGEIPLERLTTAQQQQLLKDLNHGSDRR
jgi:hypothetical protein